MTQEDLLPSVITNDDENFDASLRPKTFKDFIGQERIKENLHVCINAARKRSDVIDHILFSGPPGLGKTTLSQIISQETGVSLKSTSGPVLDKPANLAGILTNLQHGDILFIDEIHRLGKVVEEYLYSAMESFVIDILIDQGANARSVKINLPNFTLIGATTREGLLTAPFRSRFGILERFDYYPWTDLFKIAINSAKKLDIAIDEKGAEIIAKRSRGTPRIVNRFLKRARDVAQIKGNNIITEDVANESLRMLGVDKNGLGEMDRRILQTLLRSGDVPVGLKTIAISVGEEEETIEDVYESYLIQQGYINKTPRGRIATELTHKLFENDISTPDPTT
ncbi:MAG: Holliday junction branch migration DNA helicase RuvB [Candidatus Anammoxibacter sp.]